MRVKQWMKKVLCVTLVWIMAFSLTSGAPAAPAWALAAETESLTAEPESLAEETAGETQAETSSAAGSQGAEGFSGPAEEYRQLFDRLGADVLRFYWQIYEEEIGAQLAEEEYQRLEAYVEERAVERVSPQAQPSIEGEGSAGISAGISPGGEAESSPALRLQTARNENSGSYQGTSGMHTLGNGVNLATLGRNGKDVWMVTLDGETAFCMDMELLAHSGNTYVRTGTTDDSVIRRAVAYYEITNPTSSGYEYAQLYIWCGGDRDTFVRTMFEYGLSKYNSSLYSPQKLLSMSLGEMNQELNRLDAAFATSLGQACQDIENQNTQGLAAVYVFHGPSGYQRFATLYQGVWTEEGETPEPEPEPGPEPRFASVSATASAQVSYEAAVVKTDAQTGQALEGVVFAVYRDGVYQQEVTTGQDGRAVYRDSEVLETRSDEIGYCSNFDELDEEAQEQITGCRSEGEARETAQRQADERLGAMKNAASHTYAFVEVKARDGYYLDSESSQTEMTVKADGKGEESLTNWITLGEIRLQKQDLEAEAVTGQGTASLEGAIYDLYVGDQDIRHPDGKTGTAVYHGTVYENGKWVERDIALTAGTLAASARIENGELTFTGLYLGNYVIRERAKQTVTVKAADLYGQEVAETRALSYAKGYLCDPQSHSISLSWPGEDYELERAVYPGQTGSVSETVHVTETAACISREQVIKSSFRLSKLQANDETDGTGLISLSGAGFTVYRTDALSRAGQFTQGEDGLYELSSILAAYVNEAYTDQAAKYDFSGETEAVAVLYAEEEEAAAYNQTLAQGENGTGKGLVPTGTSGEYLLSELFTNENGVIQSPLLPYGQYLVVETTVPDDRFVVEPFLVTVDENSPSLLHQPVVYLLDEAFEAYLKIVKTDADTGLSVLRSGTSYRIWDLEQERYVTQRVQQSGSLERTEVFETDEEGVLILAERLPAGSYRLEEVSAPEGFYNGWAAEQEGAATFRISTGRAYAATGEQTADGRDIVVIEEKYANRETRGRLTIRKEGEILTGYEDGRFVYETVPLAGAVFEIRAAEDIRTQDLQEEADGSPALWYAEGELVASVITGAEGQAEEIIPAGDHPITRVIYEGKEGEVSLILPLGKYQVTETQAPYGFALDPDPVLVEFAWDGQEKEFVYNRYCESQSQDGSITFTNRRVKTEQKEGSGILGIGLFKEDADTKEPVAGAVYGLYTMDDIYSSEGEVILQAGELLAVSEATDAQGFAGFPVDVPVRAQEWAEGEPLNSGRYVLREEESPDGYLLNPEEIVVEFLYQGQEKEWVFTAGRGTDEKTEIQVSKRDIAGDEELPGCEMQILEERITENGERGEELVLSWVSGEEPKTVQGLKLCGEGRETVYILRESRPAEGYATAEEIRFRLWQTEDADGRPAVRTEVWTAQGGSDAFGYLLAPSAAAMETDKEGAAEDTEENLEENMEGTEAEILAAWRITGGVLVIEIGPEATAAQLEQILTEERFAGLSFREVCVQGNREDLAVEIFPENRTEEVPETEVSWSWQEAADNTVVMYNERTKGRIEKLDCLTGQPVEGAVLALLDAQGKVAEQWVTEGKSHEIAGLSPGTYTLTEIAAPPGSSYSVMEPVRFTVADTQGLWQLTVLEDHIRFTVDKIDGETGESLAGAVLRLSYLGPEEAADAAAETAGAEEGISDIAEETAGHAEEWSQEFTTDGAPLLFENMLPGRYCLTELSAPAGYEMAPPMEFVVTDSRQTQEFVLENSRIVTVRTGEPAPEEPGGSGEPEVPETAEQTETGDSSFDALGVWIALSVVCLALLAAGLIALRGKRREFP